MGTAVALLLCIGKHAVIIVGSNRAGISVQVPFIPIVIVIPVAEGSSTSAPLARRLRLPEIEAKPTALFLTFFS